MPRLTIHWFSIDLPDDPTLEAYVWEALLRFSDVNWCDWIHVKTFSVNDVELWIHRFVWWMFWSADNTNRQPSLKLTIIVRNGTRRFLNLDGIIRASEQLGFDVSLWSPKWSTELKNFHRPHPRSALERWIPTTVGKQLWGGSGPGSGRNHEPTTADNGQPAPFWHCRVRGRLTGFHRCQHRSRDVPGGCGPLLRLEYFLDGWPS